MKKAFVTIFLLASFCCYGQHGRQVAAVCSTGILINNTDTFYSSNGTVEIFSKGTEITSDEARSIFALNIIVVDSKKNLFRTKIIEFKMSVYDKSGEHVYSSNTEMLTEEMKSQLKKIQPGSKLYFEYIMAEWPDGARSNEIPLAFIIK